MKKNTLHNYYEVKALSNTALGYLKRSAYHCNEFINGRIKFDTNPMKLGRYLHAAILEPDTVRFYECKKGETNTQKLQEEKLKEGLISLSEANYAIHTGCLNSLANNEQVKLWLQNPVCEQEFYFDYQGIACKIKPDIIIEFEGKTIIIDLKFMADSQPEEFMRKGARTYDYDRQAAWYCNGYEVATGKKVDEFYFVCVEKAAPYCVSIIKITPQQLKIGKAKYDHLVSIYLDTIHVGKFPAYEGIYEWGEEEVDFDMQSKTGINFLDAMNFGNYQNIMAALKGTNTIADTLAEKLFRAGKQMVNLSENKQNTFAILMSSKPKNTSELLSYEVAKKEFNEWYKNLNGKKDYTN